MHKNSKNVSISPLSYLSFSITVKVQIKFIIGTNKNEKYSATTIIFGAIFFQNSGPFLISTKIINAVKKTDETVCVLK